MSVSFPLKMAANNVSATNITDACGGLNPSFHHCYSSEIHSFQDALRSILVVEFLITIFGVIGNTCLFFLMRRDRFAPQAFAVYFMFSAVSDSLNLIINLASDIAGTMRQDEFSSQAARENSCGWFFMATSIPSMVSPWLIVLLTLDRFIAACFPLKYSKIVNRVRGYLFASVLVLIAVIVNIPFALSYKTHRDIDDAPKKTSFSCELTMFDSSRMGELVQLIIGNIIPLVLIMLLSTAIFIALQRRNKFRGPKCCQWNRSTILVFYIAIMIFLAWFPGNIVSFIETANEARGEDSPIAAFVTDKAWHACLMLYLFSFAQNFYVLMVISPMYRAEFKKLIRLKKEDEVGEEEIEMDSDDDSTPMLKVTEPVVHSSSIPCNSVTI